MTRQSEQPMCTVYISPDERKLLAKVACGRGVGRDYLALRTARHPASSRRIPLWLGRDKVAPPNTPALPRPRALPQARHCRSCAHLSPSPTDMARRICAAGVWTQPMRVRSVSSSRRLRALSLTCTRYTTAGRAQLVAPHHCRACRQLVAADTIDERYVCGCAVWTNPMTPLSVANARRLARLSATCAHFAPSTGRWLPRS